MLDSTPTIAKDVASGQWSEFRAQAIEEDLYFEYRPPWKVTHE